MAVGHALSNWESVEGATATLFGQLVDSTSVAATRAYGTIIGARARQASLREASETFFFLRKKAYKKNRAVYSNWQVLEECARILINNYAQASQRRNDIAHGVASHLPFNKQKKSWFLTVPTYQSRNTINWIGDRAHIAEAKDLPRIYKVYYKNSEYVFGTEDIKRFSTSGASVGRDHAPHLG